jgi:tetratricopeptide (TPR) repeat protein
MYHAGRREEALRVYKDLLARDDYSPEFRSTILNYLGLSYVGLGQDDDAIKAFKASLKDTTTGRGDPAENLGILLLAKGVPAEAIPYLAEGAESHRLRSRYHLLRAQKPGVFQQ